MSQIGMLNVLYKYFTVNGEVENLREFRDESKKLTTSERLDMAQKAAIELGLTQDKVNFPLQ